MKRKTFISTLTAAGIFAAYKPRVARPQAKTEVELDELLSITDVPAIAVAGIINGRPFSTRGRS